MIMGVKSLNDEEKLKDLCLKNTELLARLDERTNHTSVIVVDIKDKLATVETDVKELKERGILKLDSKSISAIAGLLTLIIGVVVKYL